MSNSDKVRSGMEKVVATGETRMPEANLSSIDKLVFLRVELAMRSVGLSSTGKSSSALVGLTQRGFSGDTNGLQMNTLRKFNSNANLNGFDEIGSKCKKYRILRIIPVTLAIARATDIIRQYPRSLVRFAHLPAQSFHSHHLSLVLLLSSIELRLLTLHHIVSRLYYWLRHLLNSKLTHGDIQNP